MTRLGIRTIHDAILVNGRRLTVFVTTRSTFDIPRSYKSIWEKFQGLSILQEPIPDLEEGSHELDWTFVGNRKLTMVSTNDVYHTIIARHAW